MVLYFQPTGMIVLSGIALGALAALLGGYLPARQAARMPVVQALRKI